MRIRIITNPITPFGSFGVGDILNDEKYPVDFLNHLVNDCNAAEFLDQETKVDDTYEVKKKIQSLPLSEPGKVSKKKMSKSQLKRRKLSQ